MHFLFVALAGIIATFAYWIVMFLPRFLGIARVDVVRALGSFVTKDRETALAPGLVIELILGVIFAYVFYGLCAYIRGIPMNALSGLFYGFVLGAVTMLYVIVGVVEHHPDKRYQQRGPMTGVMQLVGMGAFGLVAGWLCGAWTPLH